MLLYYFLLILEMTYMSVPGIRAQIVVGRPKGKKKKRRKRSAGENLSAQKMTNHEESKDGS